MDGVLIVVEQVGSKLDKAEQGGREVSTEEGRALAEAHGAGFCEVSAKTRENVRRPFVEVVDQIVRTAGPSGVSGYGRAPGTVAVDRDEGGYLSACAC